MANPAEVKVPEVATPIADPTPVVNDALTTPQKPSSLKMETAEEQKLSEQEDLRPVKSPRPVSEPSKPIAEAI